MTKTLLIMGLPGSGKTTLAVKLAECINTRGHTVKRFNADEVRTQFNDWDFSDTGRLRQASRMRELADSATTDYVICDFVCPLAEMRDIFNADFTVWVDTIDAGRFANTNAVFVQPSCYDMRITEQDADKWATLVLDKYKN
jgi:adenylylsulfate kinase